MTYFKDSDGVADVKIKSVKDVFLHLQCDVVEVTDPQQEDPPPHSAPAPLRLCPGSPVRPGSLHWLGHHHWVVRDLTERENSVCLLHI